MKVEQAERVAWLSWELCNLAMTTCRLFGIAFFERDRWRWRGQSLGGLTDLLRHFANLQERQTCIKIAKDIIRIHLEHAPNTPILLCLICSLNASNPFFTWLVT